MNFLDNPEINLYEIKHLQDKNYTISDFEFSISFENEEISLTTCEEFINEICKTITEKKLNDLNQVFESLTKEYELEITKDLKEDSPLYQNQDVFEVENDNHDIKFVDRIRWKNEDFNMDIFLYVFEFLDPNHLFLLNRVSKEWKKLAENELLWERICKKEGREKSESTWRESFKWVELLFSEKKGIIYFVGTDGFKKDQVFNPKAFGMNPISNPKHDQEDQLISLKPGVIQVCQGNTVYFGIDFSSSRFRLLPEHYWIQHRKDYDITALRCWILEASDDGIKWDLLMQHDNDQSLVDQKQSEADWKIIPKPKKFYSMFRIIQSKSSGGTNWFNIGQFEFFGKVKTIKK